MAQMSTASMGKFDKKVNKYEPDAPNSMKVHKKKSNKKLHQLESQPNAEKDRNMKILGMMQKQKDYNAGGDKVKAAMDADKMVKKNKFKEERAKYKQNK
jgi:hypothetical protein